MKKRASCSLAALVVVAGVSAVSFGDVSAGTGDDQAAADAAIAGFSETVLDAGAVSQGAPDVTSSTADEIAADDPGLACFGDFGAGLAAGGRLDGETARAFSDNFTLPAADEVPSTDAAYYPSGDDISAAVVTVDADHQDTLDQLVAFAGSDEVATCLEDVFDGLMEDEVESADTTGGSEPPSYEIAVTAEPDIGIGDASAQFALTLATTYQGVVYGFITEVYVARVDRSIAVIIITNDDAESTSDIIDPLRMLEGLVELL